MSLLSAVRLYYWTLLSYFIIVFFLFFHSFFLISLLPIIFNITIFRAKHNAHLVYAVLMDQDMFTGMSDVALLRPVLQPTHDVCYDNFMSISSTYFLKFINAAVASNILMKRHDA